MEIMNEPESTRVMSIFPGLRKKYFALMAAQQSSSPGKLNAKEVRESLLRNGASIAAKASPPRTHARRGWVQPGGSTEKVFAYLASLPKGTVLTLAQVYKHLGLRKDCTFKAMLKAKNLRINRDARPMTYETV